MTCNLGKTERAIRVILGGVLVTIGYLADISMGAVIAIYLVGAVGPGQRDRRVLSGMEAAGHRHLPRQRTGEQSMTLIQR